MELIPWCLEWEMAKDNDEGGAYLDDLIFLRCG